MNRAIPSTLSVRVPFAVRKRGGRKLVITPDGETHRPRPRVDSALVNPIHPDCLSTKERLGEVCAILALGLLRLRARDHALGGQSSGLSGEGGESSLDHPARPSGHATRPTQRRRKA